jgi:2-amino-1-hydroxyethylphosphonate dioxygenase (glycine-forming)
MNMNEMVFRRSLSEEQAIAITDEIIRLYEFHGHGDYDGEPVSQTSHMIQCAMRAIDSQADTELVIGAFLHDVGHLLKHHQKSEMIGGFGVVDHEKLGAEYLRDKSFSDKICAVVAMHVPAKRYLVTTIPEYAGKLSDDSMQTLQWQGGLMSEEEIEDFESHPYFEEIIRVRLWDEEAKDANANLLPLCYFHKLVLDYLKSKYFAGSYK